MAKVLREQSLINALLQVTKGNEKKGIEGEYIVFKAMEVHLPSTSTVIWNPNLLNYEADLLIYDPEFDFVFIEVKNWDLDFINAFHLNGRIETKFRAENPLKQTENYRSELKDYVESIISKKIDIHKRITSMVVFPSFSKSEFQEREEVKKWSRESKSRYYKKHLFKDDLTDSSLFEKIKNTRKFNMQLNNTMLTGDIRKILNSLGQENDVVNLSERKVTSPVAEIEKEVNPNEIEIAPIENKNFWGLGLLITSIILTLVFLATSNQFIVSPNYQEDDFEKIHEIESIDEPPKARLSALEIIDSKKDEYLRKLNDTKKEMEKVKVEDSTTYALKKVEGERYDVWDQLLNEVYGVLREQLSAEEMDELRLKQREWIKYRDVTAKYESLKYKGGTLESLEYVSVLANLTEERCYELVENYMNDY